MEEEQNNEGNEESGFARFKRKVKKHVEENIETYKWVTVTAITSSAVTVAFYLLKYGRPAYSIVDELTTNFAGSNGNKQTVNYKTQTITMYGKKVGRPGIAIWDTTTGKRYESITLAAEALGLPRARIDQQLRGQRGHVNGHTFELAQ